MMQIFFFFLLDLLFLRVVVGCISDTVVCLSEDLTIDGGLSLDFFYYVHIYEYIEQRDEIFSVVLEL